MTSKWLFLYQKIIASVHTWNPNGAPCFECSLGLLLEGSNPKYIGQTGSRYKINVYIYILDYISRYVFTNSVDGRNGPLPLGVCQVKDFFFHICVLN